MNERELSLEKLTLARAAQRLRPANGTLELTPLCTMNCRMCYVQLSRAEMEAPLPLTHMTSSASDARLSASSFVSSIVTSCSSWERCSASVKPTLPSPTMMIFKFAHPFRTEGSARVH